MKVPESEYSFSYSRSAGAGGQNINKLNTKVTLIWNINETSLNSRVLERFRNSFGQFITNDGVFKVTSQRYRTQSKNKKDCLEKLKEMLNSVRSEPKKRKKTKPKKAAIEKRLKDKKSKSDIKKSRKKFDY